MTPTSQVAVTPLVRRVAVAITVVEGTVPDTTSPLIKSTVAGVLRIVGPRGLTYAALIGMTARTAIGCEAILYVEVEANDIRGFVSVCPIRQITSTTSALLADSQGFFLTGLRPETIAEACVTGSLRRNFLVSPASKGSRLQASTRPEGLTMPATRSLRLRLLTGTIARLPLILATLFRAATTWGMTKAVILAIPMDEEVSESLAATPGEGTVEVVSSGVVVRMRRPVHVHSFVCLTMCPIPVLSKRKSTDDVTKD